MKRTRIKLDTLCAILWVIFGALLCYAASRLGIGSASEPGSGFIFFWSGLIMMALSLALFFESVRESSPEIPYATQTNWARILSVLSSLVLYALFFERLGFILSTFLLMSFLLTVTEARGWPRIIGIAGAVALGSFTIFELWLQIRLPKGIYGF